MEHGPLPPHERSWRHPSELGPTKADVDPGSGHQLAALVFGGLCVMAVAGMIVAMTPRASSSPVALSSTTTPMPSVAVIGSVLVSEPAASATAAPRAAVAVSSGISSPRVPMGALLTSFTAFPHAVTSAPPLTIDGTAVADAIPADTDVVLVHTDEVTYRLTWGQVPFLNLPDGSVVFEIDGDLVAHVTGGVLLTITDD